ncbi:MAG: DNA-binding response regulator, partial [Subdoligranulum sp.]|nr:DNA-binding response regulator [Subdoligranulum sp.]
NLENEGYEVDTANSAEEALKMDICSYQLILLDVMMGEISGFKMANMLKKDKKTAKVPIIFITAKAAVEDRVRGLHSGADDYIIKPFAPPELVARVESVLRRTGRSMVVYHLLDLTVDTAACRVQCGNEEIRLTPKEYELLLLFLRNRGRALYRDYLYETVWGEDSIADSTRTLDTHVTRLRRKLHLGDRLRTVRNIGYLLEKESPQK